MDTKVLEESRGEQVDLYESSEMKQHCYSLIIIVIAKTSTFVFFDFFSLKILKY